MNLLIFSGDESGGGGRVVSPSDGQLLRLSVESGESVNSGFDENESVFGVFVLSEFFDVLADGDGLLDQVVEILRNLRSAAVLFEDSQDFLASQEPDLRNAVLVSKDDADLTGRESLFGQLHNQLGDGGRLHCRPLLWLAFEGQRRRTHSVPLSFHLHAAHCFVSNLKIKIPFIKINCSNQLFASEILFS